METSSSERHLRRLPLLTPASAALPHVGGSWSSGRFWLAGSMRKHRALPACELKLQVLPQC